MSEKACYIIGAGDFHALKREPEDGDLVIAADGGFLHMKKAGIKVDLVIGDMDSVSGQPEHPHVITLQKEKDDTDMLAAIRLGLLRGYRLFYLYGGTGGRLDHTLANLQCLAFLSGQKAKGYLYGIDYTATAVTDGCLWLDEQQDGYVSVFAHGLEAAGVTLRGLKYELTDALLTALYPVGVSNEFIGQRACVSVQRGTLLVLWYEKKNGSGGMG